jgi:hypothetical protein
MADILKSTTEVAEGVDTSIALVNLIKNKCKGYRLDLVLQKSFKAIKPLWMD